MDMSKLFGEYLEESRNGSLDQKRQTVKEILQEVVLCSLSKTDFFHKAAFYGGTALRIFHWLDRFSEDLDFSLETPIKEFSFADYLPAIENEARSYGLRLEATEKRKANPNPIQAAFVRGNAKECLLRFYLDDPAFARIPGNELLKIKMEVDTNPPRFATLERRYRLFPLSPYTIRLYDRPSLFAGKIHALICRQWKSRTKGRDFYDYVFLLTQKTPVNLRHLVERLARSGYDIPESSSQLEYVKELLRERFAQIDYEEAKADVYEFLDDKRKVDLWSSEFFCQITSSLVETRAD